MKGVKKGSAQARSYVNRKEEERILWTVNVLAYAQQETLDAVSLALNESFGFGEERLKRFHDAFSEKYAEIRKLENSDVKDREYFTAKMENALQAAWGKYYQTREERYDFKIERKN